MLRVAFTLTMALSLAWPAPVAARAGAFREDLVLELHPSGQAGGAHPVRVVFDGALHPEGVPLREGGRSVDGLEGARVTIERLTRAYAAGTLDDVLALWAPEDRDERRPHLERSFAWNQDVYREVERSLLLAEILYGDYHLLTVRHELAGGRVIVSTYPLVSRGGGYFLTQDLASDVVYQTLYLKLRETLVPGGSAAGRDETPGGRPPSDRGREPGS